MLSNLIKRNKKKGFTLVELIIVIAILAILALILIPQIGTYRQKAEKSNIQASAKTLLSAIQAYNADHDANQINTYNSADLTNSVGSGASGDNSVDLSKVPNSLITAGNVTNLQKVAEGNFTVDTVNGLNTTITIH